MSAPVIPVPGHDYQVSGSVVFEHEGKTMNGIFFSQSGIAYAGRVNRDHLGELVEVAFDADDQMIEAHPDWAAAIVREIPGVSTPLPVGYAA